MNKINIIIVFFISFSGELLSQDFSGKNNIRISILPSYENWSIPDSSGFSEFTTSLNISYLAARNTNVALSSRYASVGGNVNSLNGLSDVQLFVSQSLEDYNVVLNTGLNLPSGKTKLNQDEFITSRLISQNLFNVKTSNFGQGLNMFLGATWTYPLSENFVFGFGLSYQVKNEYQPLSTLPQKYQPSNEISLTTGFDSKLNETATITGDITAIFYGSDKLDGQEILSTGNRIIFNSIYRQYFGYNIFSVLLLYRAIGKGEFSANNQLIETEKINPNQLYLGAVFNHRLNPVTRLKYGIAVNSYEKTAAYFSGYTLFELSLSPEFRLSPMITIPVLLKYAMGSAENKSNLQNFEIGTGIRIVM